MRNRAFHVLTAGLAVFSAVAFSAAAIDAATVPDGGSGLEAGPAKDPVAPPTRVNLPTTVGNAIDSTAGPTTVEYGNVRLHLSRDALDFGPLAPATTSDVRTLSIRNDGLVPVTLAFSASPLVDRATGAEIGADRVRVSLDPARLGGPVADADTLASLVVEPGGSLEFHFRLDAPSGLNQWIPAGDYEGTVSIFAAEV